MSAHRHAGKKAGRGHKRAAPQRVAVHASKPKKKGSKYHHRGMSGLSGTQKEHEDRARDNFLTASEILDTTEKNLRKGECEEALLHLESASRFLGYAEAHYDEAQSTQGMVASDRVRRLERSLYHPDSGLTDNVRRVRRDFVSRCVIKK